MVYREITTKDKILGGFKIEHPKWYWHVPMLGRLFAYFEMKPKHTPLKRIIILLENTLLYFITGIFVCLFDPYSWLWGTLIVLIGLPIEYDLIHRHPKFFWAKQIPSVWGFVWSMYHSMSFFYLGCSLMLFGGGF